MNIDIFKILEEDYPELYSLGKDINELVFTAPHSVIVKSRVFIESLSKEIASLENMSELNKLNLVDRLSGLNSNYILNKEINECFYQVRKIGNQAAHQEVEDELVSALNVHRYVFKIACWFIETYVDFKFKSPIYKSPTPIRNNEEEKEHSNILIKLIGKVDDLLNINKSKIELNEV
ncbi:MAG: DUF4145 domain-containing protein, partial [Clostridium celatum]|nr:DUF4145 domain-containing protein [Clostridium celatum]